MEFGYKAIRLGSQVLLSMRKVYLQLPLYRYEDSYTATRRSGELLPMSVCPDPGS